MSKNAKEKGAVWSGFAVFSSLYVPLLKDFYRTIVQSSNFMTYCSFLYFQGQTDIAQHCAFTPGGALVASGAAGLTLALTWNKSAKSDSIKNAVIILKFEQSDLGLHLVCPDLSYQIIEIMMEVTVLIGFRTDRSGQTVQTQIRLLLEEQSDQGLHCLPFRQHHLGSLLYGRAT